ncbi:MAG: ATP-binding protein [Lachnospiraceae bacterium]|nr:ATP-binding protein [Lachnospiraceae bacterium]
MFSKAFSASVNGIRGLVISVEADVSDGLPIFDLVGLLSTDVKEAKERVRIALRNQGYYLPPKRITINLSPADVRKEGTAYDLAIAVAILAASGHIPSDDLEHTMLIGELSLDGRINRVNGVLPIVSAAQKQGFARCVVPAYNLEEGSVVEGIEVYGADTLNEVVHFMQAVDGLKQCDKKSRKESEEVMAAGMPDFSEITGQQAAKRAVEIAVAGQHNILLIGPPGSGKTMLAKRIPGIMPRLTFNESLDITNIYSVSGLLKEGESLVARRPFRAPHHTITTTALIGGGRVPKPGEVSLAANGVLFLDELPEFEQNTIEVLRQPLEDRQVTVSRLNAAYTYPANFMLVAAMNPCRCGFYPDHSKCSCSIRDVKKYLSKLSRPLLDRIDICMETAPVSYKELEMQEEREDSCAIRERVEKARKIQLNRYEGTGIYFNSMLSVKDIGVYCKIGKREKALLEKAFIKMNLSARAYHRILRVARTIADLDGSEKIKEVHLSEAICYRSLDKKYWGEI